jgi:hypothetical protein
MKFIALLFLSVVTLHAAPKVEVEWTFEKKPAEIAIGTNARFQPAREFKMLVPMGERRSLSYMRDIPLAREFALPRPVGDGSIAVIPSVPQSFDAEPFGYKLELQAFETGPIIRLVGLLTIRDFHMEQGIFGEKSAPIYGDVVVDGKKRRILLTPNTAQTSRVQSTESRFQVNALPGKTYTVTLQSPQGPIKAKVRCKLKA